VVVAATTAKNKRQDKNHGYNDNAYKKLSFNSSCNAIRLQKGVTTIITVIKSSTPLSSNAWQ
jgi:hypothetical protein